MPNWLGDALHIQRVGLCLEKIAMSYTEIEEKTLSYYRNFNERMARRDENTGKADGKRSFPNSATPTYPFRDEVLTHARRAIQAFDMESQKAIKVLQIRIASLERERDEHYGRQRDDEENSRQVELNKLSQTKGPESPRYLRLRQQFEALIAYEQAIYMDIQRPLRISMRWIYFPILLLLALAEIPINRLAFEFFFQETAAISLAIATVLGLMMMFCAHLAGLWLRQAAHYPNKSARILRYVCVVIVVAILFVVIYFIAALRQGYVNLLEREAVTDFGTLLQGDVSGLGTLANEALSTDLGVAGLTLLGINVLLFMCGLFAAYIRHDPHPDYERVIRERIKIEGRMHRMEDRYQTRFAALNADFDRRVGYLDRKFDRTEDEIEVAHGEIAAIRERRSEIVKMVSEVIVMRLLSYQKGHRSTRKAGEATEIFERPDRDVIANELCSD